MSYCLSFLKAVNGNFAALSVQCKRKKVPKCLKSSNWRRLTSFEDLNCTLKVTDIAEIGNNIPLRWSNFKSNNIIAAKKIIIK
jgi:hypothetical protein